MGSSFTVARPSRFLRAAVLVGIAVLLGGTVLTCARKPARASARRAQNAEPANATEANIAAVKLNQRGNRYFEINECDSALACYRQALALAEKFDLADRRHAALSNVANTYDDRAHLAGRTREQVLADLDSAATGYTQLLEIVRAMNNPQDEALLLFNVAQFYFQSRLDPARAESLYSQSIAISERIDDRGVWTMAVYGRAFERAYLFRLEAARRDFAAVLKVGRERGAVRSFNASWSEQYVALLDTLIRLKSRLSPREWQQLAEERRAEFRDGARELKKLGAAEPSGFGRKEDGK